MKDDLDRFSFVKNGYNKVAPSYTEGRENIDISKEFNAFIELLKPKSHIIDVGCGTAVPVLKTLTEKGHIMTGIDLSDKMIEVARQNVPTATFLRMNMTELDFPDATFDALVSCYAVFHVPRTMHAGIFSSFHQILKPGGIMLVSVGASHWEGVEDYYNTQMFWSQLSPEQSQDLIKSAGFEIIFSRNHSDGGETHHWILARKI